jgi:hypothetical protein
MPSDCKCNTPSSHYSFRSVTYPKIAMDQTRLTLEFFTIVLSEKKVYLDDISTLSILLNLEPVCHSKHEN